MPHVPVTFELEYVRITHSVPADSETQVAWPTPEGMAIISWGHSDIDSFVFVVAAYITLDENGAQQFVASLRNTDTVNDTATHWNLVLLKLS